MQMRKRLTVTFAGVAAALVVGSMAWAAIPDNGGVIRGCYEKASGNLRVTDTTTNSPKACTAKETALDWNQRGPQGPQGDPGPQGPAGNSPEADAYLDHFGTDVNLANPALNVPCVLGEIKLSASWSRTAGGVPANGQLMSIQQNTALFALLGNTYGGDGKLSFALPDMRPITPNNMTYSICIVGTWPS